LETSDHPPADPRRDERGFTLIEVVVALAVVAMALGAIGNLVNVTRRSTLHLERHLGDVETAQTWLATPPSRAEIAGGSLKGELAGRAWRMEAQPYRAAFFAPVANAKWVPVKVTLTVRAPGGAPLNIETIRLIRAAGQ
jgi:prepilin-type N-terminal cleavage/methylation domain-containing protein